MTRYEITLRIEVAADTAEEARAELEKPLDELFSWPAVIAMDVTKPTWIAVSERAEARA